MKKLIIANWKCNPDSAGRAVALARKIDRAIPFSKKVDVVIAPSFPHLSHVASCLSRAKLGAQDMFWEDVGPYTGEISWHQLKHLRVKYVIIGHSERRRLLNETEEMINKKILAALKASLKVILCVGEPLAVRKKGVAASKRYIKDQLKEDLKSLSPKSYVLSSLIITYEPLWAISTSDTHQIDTPEDAALMARFIKNQLPATRYQVPVLYGGSVDSKNIGDFLQYKEIDGALVGGASLKVKEFAAIIKVAAA